MYGRSELDSHADTTVTGVDCCILQYTVKECDVSPYRDDYESIKGVPIACTETVWKSPDKGQTYILVLHEALWMVDTLYLTSVNPNQLCNYGTRVQDNPISEKLLSIITSFGIT